MKNFSLEFKTIWANFDPNRHMRHTAYSDYAAEVRVRFFQQHQLRMDDFAHYNIGPVIFEEQTVYLKEINIGENIKVDMELLAASKNFERWEFIHHIYNEKNELSAKVRVKGAWIDLKKRKLTNLPSDIVKQLHQIPKSLDFKEITLKSKNNQPNE